MPTTIHGYSTRVQARAVGVVLETPSENPDKIGRLPRRRGSTPSPKDLEVKEEAQPFEEKYADHMEEENKQVDPSASLAAEIKHLQEQLEQERLHNRLLTAMIDIAEDELKIPIRKKYGTRQSKK